MTADAEPYTKIPNALLDAMGQLGNAELRVLLAMIRKTAGWGKACDVISVSQLAAMTGLTSRNTQRAVEALLERGLIDRERVGKQNYCYTVKPYPLGTRLDNHIPTDTMSPRDTEPYPLGTRLEEKPYPLGITQKKDLKEKKEKRESTRAPVSLDFLHEGVTTYKRLTGKRTVAPAVATQIAETITDLPLWENVITAWCGKYRAENVTGMLDWYAHPDKMRSTNGTLRPTTHNGRHPDPRTEWAGFTETDLDKPF